MSGSQPHPRRKLLPTLTLAVTLLYVVLLIPDTELPPPSHSSSRSFAWNQDSLWERLEAGFVEARAAGCQGLEGQIASGLSTLRMLTSRLFQLSTLPTDTIFDVCESTVFFLGPLVAACPENLHDYIAAVNLLRTEVKNQSAYWSMNDQVTRDRLYRLLYGSRAAIEEAMLQAPAQLVPASLLCYDEPSHTPSATILGITIQSGDILVSRGGAATSALISRGNDYPGNFSHVALVHVDSIGKVSIIESHIEKGVAIAGIDEYLRDTKLRVMILRLRSDLPALRMNPMLPHAAATYALSEANARYIPYDFAMDFRDGTKLFCSEVASDAYRRVGVILWMGISTISSAGVSSWLADFGVRHFETQEPADLEYDPQLRVVAEWRDPATLHKDHLDNAVIDAMLEEAEAGKRLTYVWYLLPLVRVAKGYSALLNALGEIGPVPEGMNATAALKHREFSKRHEEVTSRLRFRAEQFVIHNGYRPPYWQLVRMARAEVALDAR
jgi:hypothetical protein